MTPFNIWIKAQIAALLLALPILIVPPLLYILIIATNVAFGLPAIVFFYLLLMLVRHFLTNQKPVTTWVAALACLPGMLLITGGCVITGTIVMCNAFNLSFDWEFTLFGLPAMIGTAISVCISRKDIHRFIYPDLYADNFKKDTPQFPGMVDT